MSEDISDCPYLRICTEKTTKSFYRSTCQFLQRECAQFQERRAERKAREAKEWEQEELIAERITPKEWYDRDWIERGIVYSFASGISVLVFIYLLKFAGFI